MNCFSAGIQEIGSDPVLAVNKAIEGIENNINHMNNMFNEAHGMISLRKTIF